MSWAEAQYIIESLKESKNTEKMIIRNKGVKAEAYQINSSGGFSLFSIMGKGKITHLHIVCSDYVAVEIAVDGGPVTPDKIPFLIERGSQFFYTGLVDLDIDLEFEKRVDIRVRETKYNGNAGGLYGNITYALAVK